MLEVYMAMMGNNFFPKNYVLLIMARMIYAKVVLGVKVNRRTILANRTNNVPPYQLDKFAGANPFALPITHPPPTTILLVFTRRPWVPPQFAHVIPPFSFQLVPPILVIPKTTTLNIFCIQDLDLVMSDRIV